MMKMTGGYILSLMVKNFNQASFDQVLFVGLYGSREYPWMAVLERPFFSRM
jgi:hypothetical protein